MSTFSHPTFDANGKVVLAGAAPELVPLIALVFIQVVYVTAVYGPIAAFLVEFFPAKIRYTSLSLPYHLANGWFGGFRPLIAPTIVAATGNIYAGLFYPIIVALMTVVVGGLFIKESFRNRIWDEVGGHIDPNAPPRGEGPPASALAG